MTVPPFSVQKRDDTCCLLSDAGRFMCVNDIYMPGTCSKGEIFILMHKLMQVSLTEFLIIIIIF